MINYRSAFIRLALYYGNAALDKEKATACLDRMEQLIPRSKIPMGWELQSDIASFYHRLGHDDKFNELANEIEPAVLELIATKQFNLNSYYNPYRVLLEIYETQKTPQKSLDLLRTLSTEYPNDPNLKQRITMLEAQVKEMGGNKQADTDSAS